MNKYNVFWFIIDSVRTYRTGIDDRDWLDVMDDFAQDAVSFTNCYTSAPSSLLAAGSMFTGLPSVYVARHFNDWKFKGSNLTTVTSLVKEHQYTSFPLLNSREEREKYQFLLPPFKKKYLPQKYRLSDYAWRNWEITEIFEHMMDNNQFDQPLATTFWYDCRRDPNTSASVEKAIRKIKEQGLYENSIIIMQSDHGYPDPSTNLNEGFFKDYGHDMILTDDNIKTPLLIKYPGCNGNVKISNVVGHIDILPTIYDILDIPFGSTVTPFMGKSLIPIIEGKESDKRIRRTDTRLSMDSGRITSLTSSNYKFMHFYDDNSQLLFNQQSDPANIINLLEDPSAEMSNEKNKFIQVLEDYETDLLKYHKNELFNNLKKAIEYRVKQSSDEGANILIVSNSNPELVMILRQGLIRLIDKAQVGLLTSSNNIYDNLDSSNIIKVDEINNSIKSQELPKYDHVFYLTENSRRVYLKDSIVKGVKSIPSKKYYMLNYNFEIFEYFGLKSIFSYFKIFFDWEVKGYFYKQEPIIFLKDLLYILRKMVKTLYKSKAKENMDLLSAKEIYEFRKYHLKGNESGLSAMDDDEMENEFSRIKTRE
jgi:hypothetical protein